ncbi:MAG TPA: carboxyl transferase domain-containing protein, partial [Actinomycetes bacterium]|nr:carboxyl transferase domain-containing protein [Actinomycetes bacterium]
MAEEWVEGLLDPGSFVASATGVRSGHGTLDGRPVCVADGHGDDALAAFDLALKVGCPVVTAAGAGEVAGPPGPDGAGGLLSRRVLASGVVPQVALVLGPCAGGPALAAALA